MITIDEAVNFQREEAKKLREKILRKSQQSFKDKALCINRWINEANMYEQSALLLERLKIIEQEHIWQEEKY